MRKDQGSDRSLWQTTVKSGEVRETVINGAPLCAISKIRFKQIKSFPLNSTPKLVKSREARLQQITPIANIDPRFVWASIWCSVYAETQVSKFESLITLL